METQIRTHQWILWILSLEIGGSYIRGVSVSGHFRQDPVYFVIVTKIIVSSSTIRGQQFGTNLFILWEKIFFWSTFMPIAFKWGKGTWEEVKEK